MSVIKETAKHETSYVIIPKDEYESMKATIEVLSDKELIEQIKKSKEDVKKGRIKKWGEFIDEL